MSRRRFWLGELSARENLRRIYWISRNHIDREGMMPTIIALIVLVGCLLAWRIV